MRSPWRNAWLLALAPFALAACAAPDTAEDAETAAEEAAPAAEAPPPADEPSTYMAQFNALNESGTTGQIEVRAAGTGTELRVMLTGATEGVHQGHIHTGTCDAPGDVVTPLEPITVDAAGSGEATATVDIPVMTVANGSHIVLYHEAGGEPGQPIACAQIPTQM